MKNNIEELLQQALSADAEPSPWLNEKILQTVKEKQEMKRFTRKPFGAVAIAATLIVCSLCAFAGWKYLAPAEVAKNFTDFQLSKAFESEDAIIINETQEFDDYVITLLGITSGKNLSESMSWDENGIRDDRSYIVTAIENADGTPRPDTSDDAYGMDPFYVSPYVQGLSITQHNAHTFGGGYKEDVIDGIQYRILECDNIEIFAKKTIYLGVNEGSFCDTQAFIMDEGTGEITRNESYDGINALFTLPIPAFKGDEAAVEDYLNNLFHDDAESDDMITDDSIRYEQITKEISDWSLEDFEANATLVYEQELIPDSEGYISYNYRLENGSGSSREKFLAEILFEDPESSFSKNSMLSSDGESIHIDTFELLDNGHVMLRVYSFEAN